MIDLFTLKNNIVDIEYVRGRFIKHFDGTTGAVYASSGRINLIGKYTDYSDDFIFPGAINKGIVVGVRLNRASTVKAYFIDLKDYVELDLSEEDAPRVSWARYISGACREMTKCGVEVRGFNTTFAGNVPLDADISSSAALESTYAYTLNDLFSDNRIDKFGLAKAGQTTEHSYYGVNCGTMGRFASVFGKKGGLIRLDCRLLEYQYFPSGPESCRLVLINSVVKYEPTSSAYNGRRRSYEVAVAAIQRKHPHVEFLHDCSIEILKEARTSISTEDFMRTERVIEEIQRVLDVCDTSEKGDYETAGQEIYETHRGTSKLYEAGYEGFDFLNDLAFDYGVTDSRTMSGGFGGYTISLVKEKLYSTFTEEAKEGSKKRFNGSPKIYNVIISDGAQRLE